MATDPLDPNAIGFRRLAHTDLHLMHRWLNAGPALEWYGQMPKTLDQITTDYTPQIEGTEAVRGYLILYGDAPVGFIQEYSIRDHPDYWGHMGFPDDTAGVDLFIGEERFLYRGLGPHLLRRFLREILFADPSINRCIIDPDPANRAAIRAYEKTGFRYLATIGPPAHIEPSYVMVLERGDLGDT